ncbi:MAG TPA: RNA-binding protein, partial [Gammaproteobacteria bacterium]|nr:RNA-binding protein [Gammaproteobacteria bacterium]
QLAAQAIRGGLVQYNGQRVKPSQNVSIGSEVWLRIGQTQRTLRVCALAEQRKSAKIAALLYQETPESVLSRQATTMMFHASKIIPGPKPNKRERRQRQKLVGR